jgi:hypothetical protein
MHTLHFAWPFVDGYVGCLHLTVTVNNTAVSIKPSLYEVIQWFQTIFHKASFHLLYM